MVESVEAVLTDSDADLFNITEAMVADNQQGAAFAYATFAASVVELAIRPGTSSIPGASGGTARDESPVRGASTRALSDLRPTFAA